MAEKSIVKIYMAKDHTYLQQYKAEIFTLDVGAIVG